MITDSKAFLTATIFYPRYSIRASSFSEIICQVCLNRAECYLPDNPEVLFVSGNACFQVRRTADDPVIPHSAYKRENRNSTDQYRPGMDVFLCVFSRFVYFLFGGIAGIYGLPVRTSLFRIFNVYLIVCPDKTETCQ